MDPDAIIGRVKVSTERTPDSQLILEIEVDEDRLESSLNKAYRRLVQRTAVPGFRKGKAPRPMLERHLGHHRLLHEALDILVPEVYEEAIKENGIEPLDQPQLEILQEEPLPIIKATVPLQPTVELGDYRSLRLEREPVEVDAAEVEAALEDLRRRYAVHEPVERPVSMGDIVRLDVKATVEGKTFYEDEDAEVRLREGGVVMVPGFAEALVGVKKDEPKEIMITVPKDYEEADLAGKPCVFSVLVHEIKQEQLPKLNDDFAREVGEGFPNLKALRSHLENEARERLEQQGQGGYYDKIVDGLAESAGKIEFPPVLLDREIERLLREEARTAGTDTGAYLERMKLSPEELRDRFREQAEENVRRSLVLTKVSELEGLGVEHEEIDAEIDRMAAGAGPQGDQMRMLFASAAGHEAIGRSLLTRKTLERLAAIAAGAEVPPLEPPIEVEKDAPEPKSKTKRKELVAKEG